MKFQGKKLKNIFIYLLSFTASAIGIGLNFFLSKVLGAENYGSLQYYVALATTISQFALFGLNSFLIREAKNESQNGQAFNKCTSLYFVIILFILPILYPVLYYAIPNTTGNIVATTTVIVTAILMGLNALLAANFQGNGKFQFSIIFENLIPKLFLLIIAIIFYFIHQLGILEEYYLVFYICIYGLICVPIILKYFRKINLKFSKSEFLSIVFFFGVTVTYSLGNNLTKVLQGGLYENEVALGIISVSLNIINLVTVFTSVLTNMVKPIFAKKKRENDMDGLISIYRFNTRVSSYFAIPLFLFFIMHSTKFLLLFGEDYTVYPYILLVLSLANLINELTGPNGTMLAMTGKEKWELFNGLLYFAVYFIFIFIYSFDPIYGLCYTLLTAQIVVNAAKFIEVGIIFKVIPLDLKTLLTLVIILVVDSAIIWPLTYLQIELWAWILIGVVIGATLVLLNCFLLSIYRKTDFKNLLNLKV